MHIEVDWDDAKAEINLRKHGISFEEAASSLLDPLASAQEDDTATGEPRWALIGMSTNFRLLTVVYTLREDRIRLISARKATRSEASSYA